jgi:hypothetical protein
METLGQCAGFEIIPAVKIQVEIWVEASESRRTGRVLDQFYVDCAVYV